MKTNELLQSLNHLSETLPPSWLKLIFIIIMRGNCKLAIGLICCVQIPLEFAAVKRIYLSWKIFIFESFILHQTFLMVRHITPLGPLQQLRS